MGRSRRRVVFRPLADEDLDIQFEYLAIEAGLETAQRFLEAVRRTCTVLLENPHMGSPRSFADQRLRGLRVWPVQGFRRQLVFYIASARGIEVIRLLHGSRDAERLFTR
jgi:toxin ParE1/3/4